MKNLLPECFIVHTENDSTADDFDEMTEDDKNLPVFSYEEFLALYRGNDVIFLCYNDEENSFICNYLHEREYKWSSGHAILNYTQPENELSIYVKEDGYCRHANAEYYIEKEKYNNITKIKASKFMKTKKSIQVKKSDLKKIYDVACETWKVEIADLAKSNTFDDFVELTKDQVDEMFKAVTREQLPVLESIFGEREKPLTVATMPEKVLCEYGSDHYYWKEDDRVFEFVLDDHTITPRGFRKVSSYGDGVVNVIGDSLTIG